jgi:methionyl-tRNA formyltransferase
MPQDQDKNIAFAFFGTSEISVTVLNELKKHNLVPKLIVTTEDKPQGRKMILTPPPTKVWAETEKVPYLQLKTLKTPESESVIRKYCENYDVFIVASYGKLIPQNILDIPTHKTLNVHPSLLPKLRGPSPIKSAILSENETGVTIIRLDSEMDHGPILEQKKVPVTNWPSYENELEELLGKVGAEMLVDILPKCIAGEIQEKEQDHNKATFCQKITKSDGEINLKDNPEKNLRKIRAFHIWPTAYFFDNQKRIVIKTAHIEDGKLILDKVVPEGKKEMGYEDYLRGKKS